MGRKKSKVAIKSYFFKVRQIKLINFKEMFQDNSETGEAIKYNLMIKIATFTWLLFSLISK